MPERECTPRRAKARPPKDSQQITKAAIAAVQAAGEDVVRELRELALYELPAKTTLPLPHDLDAEEACMEALVAGRRTPKQLNLAATDFFYPAYRAVVSVLEALEDKGMLEGKAPNLSLVLHALAADGIHVERMTDMLDGLLNDVPMSADIAPKAARIAELAKQRAIIAMMQRLDALWRIGEKAPDDSINDLVIALEALP